LAIQTVFKRYEIKYLLTEAQQQRVLEAMKPYMQLDDYGRTTIRNLYFDTDDYRLIRRSMEKPVYKEKLRIRSYSTAAPDSPVFVELKKKYRSVVYKRRVRLPLQGALDWTTGKCGCMIQNQISEEIDYFLSFYASLHPTVFLSYEREAYYALDNGDFRVTFDDHILCRRESLSLCEEAWGTPLLPEGMVMMELKCSGGIPLWMTEVLTREHIYKTSFSKYGTAYEKLIYPKLKEETQHV